MPLNSIKKFKGLIIFLLNTMRADFAGETVKPLMYKNRESLSADFSRDLRALPIFEDLTYRAISSANWRILQSLERHRLQPEVYKLKKRVLSIDPCGIPLSDRNWGEISPLMTNWMLL